MFLITEILIIYYHYTKSWNTQYAACHLVQLWQHGTVLSPEQETEMPRFA